MDCLWEKGWQVEDAHIDHIDFFVSFNTYQNWYNVSFLHLTEECEVCF